MFVSYWKREGGLFWTVYMSECMVQNNSENYAKIRTEAAVLSGHAVVIQQETVNQQKKPFLKQEV